MSQTPTNLFSAALADLLEPLSRAMIAQGVTLGAATESLKQALLDAAIDAEGETVSDSRISVMTGLHRKDVRRLRSNRSADSGRRSASRVAGLIGYWSTAPDFQGVDGLPRVLARETDDEGPGFNDLVRRVRFDVASGTILQTLIDQGAVTQEKDGRYRLARNALVPRAGSKELVAAYRATLTAHMNAATQNLLVGEGDARNFDRVVRYSHLSDASVTELEALARKEAQAMLERLNARALVLQNRDAPENARGRFAAGAYVLPTPNVKGKETE